MKIGVPLLVDLIRLLVLGYHVVLESFEYIHKEPLFVSSFLKPRITIIVQATELNIEM